MHAGDYAHNKQNIISYLERLLRRQNLSRTESGHALKIFLDHGLEHANDVSFGALFAAMQTKGATKDEVLGLMDTVITYDRVGVDIAEGRILHGIIGSGKDQHKTFNISSLASLVAASVGIPVVKNGSRSEASVSGTTDVFEYVGVDVTQRDPRILSRALEELNFIFCDAEPFFPKMVKEYLGKFFFVHPLSYILPIASGVTFSRVVFGIADTNTHFTATLLRDMGYTPSLVVCGTTRDGKCFDEMSNVGLTHVSEIASDGSISEYTLSPHDLSLEERQPEEIAESSSLDGNATIFMQVLEGTATPAQIDIVLLNAGALLYVAREVGSISQGVLRAREALRAGKPLHLLQQYRDSIKQSV